MNRVFADANYLIALINRDDELHDAAVKVQRQTKHSKLYTTDEVLCEVLNFFGERGSRWREKAVQMVEGIRADSAVVVNPQSRGSFDDGMVLYRNRPDKGYSLVDCVSFLAMTHHGITEALTNDRHFEQEGFTALLRDKSR